MKRISMKQPSLSSLRNKIGRKDIICVAVIVPVLAGLGINFWFQHRQQPLPAYNMQLSKDTALESHFLVAGDVYWGRRMYDKSQATDLKEKYPFSRLNEFNRDSYDTWVANLECPSVESVKQPVGYDPGLVKFNCDSSYMSEFAKYFDIVSLANNHTQNQSREAGLAATRTTLDKNSIQYFGNFTPHVKEDICEVIAMPARAIVNNKQQKVNIPVAMCGYAGVYFTVKDDEIAEIQKYSQYMPVIVYPHMGVEYQTNADSDRRELYHKFIDAGADAVLGNHPHITQPTEVYKGKLIAYSMGNFIFDQEFSDEVKRSVAFDTTMSVKSSGVTPEQVAAWTKLGDTCRTFKDNCLAEATAQKLQKLPIALSYKPIGVDTSNMITKPASYKMYTALINRIDWKSTSAQLAQ